jgi:serine/threonine protein kinase
MTAADANLATLSDDKRQVLEAWLVDFDLTWNEDRMASAVRRLPHDSLRRPALVEMIKIDLERRWQRGQPATLESYLKSIPELGGPERLPPDLLLAEYEARQFSGVPASLAEFARRFPRQAEDLRQLVAQIQDEQLNATRLPTQETLPPNQSTPVPGGAIRGSVSVPEQFGRYRILREVGRGAMGTVYLAHDSQLDRLVALKVPQFTAAEAPELRQRFLTECRAAATIEHPSICPVYDVGEINGIPYLTMAYLQGQPLAQLLEAPMPERQAASIARQLALALQAAHQRGIIHRDLKPSNIMINLRGEPVVLDFGLARRLSPGGANLTHFGQPLGTPAYMSPEQVAGAVGKMGPACDIYALGVILYQLLTCRLPFEGSVAEVLTQIVTQSPAPPSKHRPGLDARLEAVCLKALSKQPSDRQASMRDLAAALTDYLNPATSPAAQPAALAAPLPLPGADARPQAAWFRSRALWLLLAGGAVAMGAAAVATLAGILIWLNSSPATGSIRINLESAPDQVEVQLDGERLDSTALDRPLQLQPGKHHLLVTGKKIQPYSSSFEVARGDNPALRVPLVAAADPAPNPDPPQPPRRKREREREIDDD